MDKINRIAARVPQNMMGNRRGDNTSPFWIIIGIVIAMIVLVVVIMIFAKGVTEGNPSNMNVCENKGAGAGCVAESEVSAKEDEGLNCFKNMFGCKEAEPYCCFKV